MIIWGEAIPVLERFGIVEPALLTLAERRLRNRKCKRNPSADAFPDYAVVHAAVHAFLCFKGVGAATFTAYLACTAEILSMMRSFFKLETRKQCVLEIIEKWGNAGCNVSILESITDLTWQMRALDRPGLELGSVKPARPAI